MNQGELLKQRYQQIFDRYDVSHVGKLDANQIQ